MGPDDEPIAGQERAHGNEVFQRARDLARQDHTEDVLDFEFLAERERSDR